VEYLENSAVVQTVRTTPHFFGRPWYDKVLTLGAPGRPNRYALLMALFWWEEKELALVRYFKEVRCRTGDILAAEPWRCKPLVWATRPSNDGGHEPDVCVTEIESIIRTVYIVPDFYFIDTATETRMERVGEVAAGVERWHVSTFKHMRSVPDCRPIDPELIGVQIAGAECASSLSRQQLDEEGLPPSGNRDDDEVAMDWVPVGYDNVETRQQFWEGVPD
jgi:hypothetical protein